MECGGLPPLSPNQNVSQENELGEASLAHLAHSFSVYRRGAACCAQLATMSADRSLVGAVREPRREIATHAVSRTRNLTRTKSAGIIKKGGIAGGAWGKFSARNLRLSN